MILLFNCYSFQSFHEKEREREFGLQCRQTYDLKSTCLQKIKNRRPKKKQIFPGRPKKVPAVGNVQLAREEGQSEPSTPARGRLPALHLQNRPPPGASWPRSWVSLPGGPEGPRTMHLHRTGSEVAGLTEEKAEKKKEEKKILQAYPVPWGCWSRRARWRKEVTSSWR